MKKIALILVGLIIFGNPVASIAQSDQFEYRLIRTANAPGFFQLNIWWPKQLPNLDLQTIFINNTTFREQAAWSELYTILQEGGQRIISAKNIDQLQPDKNTRLIWIGDNPPKKWPNQSLHFPLLGPGALLERWVEFNAHQLGPAKLRDLQLTFGGNISQAFPLQINYAGESGVVVFGKFDRPIKTRLSLTAESKYGPTAITGPLDLTTFQSDPLYAATLPNLWERGWKKQHSVLASSSWSHFWLDIFPLLLVVIGLCMLWQIRRIYRRTRTNPITPSELPNNLPFELKK